MSAPTTPAYSRGATVGSTLVRGASQHRGRMLVDAVVGGLSAGASRLGPEHTEPLQIPEIKVRLRAGAGASQIKAALARALTQAIEARLS